MPKLQVFRMRGRANRGLTLQARVYNPNGSAITQAALSKVQVIVKNQAGSVTKALTDLTISSVVNDSFVNDSRWVEDSTGRNFLYEVPAAAFPARGFYRVEVLFTPSSGEVYSVIWEGPIESSFSFST